VSARWCGDAWWYLLLFQPGSARISPGLYRALLRLLAHGEPVTIGQLAAIAGRPADHVTRVVAGWSDTEYDQQGRIIAYGLTLRPMPHLFTLDGKQLYTWCALDTLFFPAIVGRLARVESPAPARARLYVSPSIRRPASLPSTQPPLLFRLSPQSGQAPSAQTSATLAASSPPGMRHANGTPSIPE
jgi:hypothetical protein